MEGKNTLFALKAKREKLQALRDRVSSLHRLKTHENRQGAGRSFPVQSEFQVGTYGLGLFSIIQQCRHGDTNQTLCFTPKEQAALKKTVEKALARRKGQYV